MLSAPAKVAGNLSPQWPEITPPLTKQVRSDDKLKVCFRFVGVIIRFYHFEDQRRIGFESLNLLLRQGSVVFLCNLRPCRNSRSYCCSDGGGGGGQDCKNKRIC